MKSTKTMHGLLLFAVMLLCFLPAISFGATCPVGQIETNSVCAPPTPEQALDLLIEGNSSYISGDITRLKSFSTPAVRTEVDAGQHPYAVVLTCSDSRVPPEILFNKGLGEIFTVRVAGNLVAAHELGSIEYAVEHLGARLIVVLGHEKCGAVKTTYDSHGMDTSSLGPNLNSLISSIDPAVTAVLAADGGKAAGAAEQAAQVEECVAENAKMVVESLESSSNILKEFAELGELKIVQAKYDLDDGRVTFVLNKPAELFYPTTNTTGNYTLYWKKLADTGISYVVEEKVNGGSWVEISSQTGDSITFTGKANGTYQYRIKTVKANSISQWTTGPVLTINLTSSLPTGPFVAATSTTGTYQVYWGYSTTPGARYTLYENGIAVLTASQNAYYNTSNKANGTYTYTLKVTAAGFAESALSSGASIVVSKSAVLPGGPYAPATSSNGSYQVYWGYSTTPGARYTLFENGVAVLAASPNTYFNTSNKANGTYNYTLQVTAAGFNPSAVSVAASVSVAKGPAALPTGPYAPATSANGSYQVYWGYSTTPGARYTLFENGVAVLTASSNTYYNASNKANGTYNYTLQVTAAGYNPSAVSAATSVSVAKVAALPTGPYAPSTSASGSYQVYWGYSTTPGARYTLFENGVAVLTASPNTYFNVSNKPNGTYNYTIQVTAAGFSTSPVSAATATVVLH